MFSPRQGDYLVGKLESLGHDAREVIKEVYPIGHCEFNDTYTEWVHEYEANASYRALKIQHLCFQNMA